MAPISAGSLPGSGASTSTCATSPPEKERRVTHATARDVLGWLWASDDRLVYAQDSGGDENYRLYAVKADGSGAIDLTPFEGVKCGLVDDLEDEPDQVLFQMNRRDPRVFDAYRANVATGEIQLVAENPGNVTGWVTDWSGRIRAASANDGVSTSLLYRETEAAPWRTVATHDFRETAPAAPLHLRRPSPPRVLQRRPRQDRDLRVRPDDRRARGADLRAPRGGRRRAHTSRGGAGS